MLKGNTTVGSGWEASKAIIAAVHRIAFRCFSMDSSAWIVYWPIPVAAWSEVWVCRRSLSVLKTIVYCSHILFDVCGEIKRD